MTPVLAFDIETVPDIAGLRRIYGLPQDMTDGDVAELAFHRRRQVTGTDFLPGSFVPYTVNVPLARAIEEDVLLVHTWEGRPLPREHGGPVRMITPKLYAWKGGGWTCRSSTTARWCMV
jgi:DMSO/TMAO reductase YedYZ molybdopterin-dependent catalytic subunit